MRQQSGQPSAKSRGGRPPKFRGPRRPVTVTLPERTLTLLDAVHRDRARAIVRVTDALAADTPESWLVDVVEVLPGLGIILVGPSRLLPNISWLRLIELTPTRYLLSIPSGTPVESLEVALQDLLEASTPDDVRERTILERLGGLVRMLEPRRDLQGGDAVRGHDPGASRLEVVRGPKGRGRRRNDQCSRAGRARDLGRRPEAPSALARARPPPDLSSGRDPLAKETTGQERSRFASPGTRPVPRRNPVWQRGASSSARRPGCTGNRTVRKAGKVAPCRLRSLREALTHRGERRATAYPPRGGLATQLLAK